MTAKPAKPYMSGFCEAAPQYRDPSQAHALCRTAACICPCHKTLVERLADQPPPDGGTVTYEVAPPERVKVPLACLQGRHTETCGHLEPPVLDPPAVPEVTAPHPDGELNCAYARNAEGNLECVHGCGRAHDDRGQTAPLAGLKLGNGGLWESAASDPRTELAQATANRVAEVLGVPVLLPDQVPLGAVVVDAEPVVMRPAPPSDDDYRWPVLEGGRQNGKTATLEAVAELTEDERRRVIAAHMVLRPETILQTVTAIVNERQHP